MKKDKKTKSESLPLPALISFPGRAFSFGKTEILRAEGQTENGVFYKLRFPAAEEARFSPLNLFLQKLSSAWFCRISSLSEKEGVISSSFSLNFQEEDAPSLLLREVTKFQNGEKKRWEIRNSLSDLMIENTPKNTKNRKSRANKYK